MSGRTSTPCALYESSEYPKQEVLSRVESSMLFFSPLMYLCHSLQFFLSSILRMVVFMRERICDSGVPDIEQQSANTRAVRLHTSPIGKYPYSYMPFLFVLNRDRADA